MDIDRSIMAICAFDHEKYTEAIEAGVTADLFVEPVCAEWTWCLEHMKNHGKGPSLEALENQFSTGYEWPPSEPISFYIEKLKERNAFNLTLQAVSTAYEALNEKRIDDAVSLLRDAVSSIEDTNTEEVDLDWGATTEERYESYLRLQEKGGIDGFRTPFPTLDEATQGFHSGEYILVVARQGVGKTWLTNVLAHKNISEGLKVLYFSKEMPKKQIARRFDALNFSLPYQSLRSGRLNSFIETRWKEESKQKQGNLIIVGPGSGGVSHVAAKIQKHCPDIVYIDGMYLMDDDQKARDGWERVAHISRDLKKLSGRVGTPIIATVQFNRKADNSKGDPSQIASSDIARDADVILGLFQDEDQKIARRMTLRVLKQREGERPEVECDWDWERMVFTEADISSDQTVGF